MNSFQIVLPALPIVAIGGITESNAPVLFQSGADGVAVISTICESPDIIQTVTLLKSSSV